MMRLILTLVVTMLLSAPAAVAGTASGSKAPEATTDSTVTMRPYDYFFQYLPMAAKAAANDPAHVEIFKMPAVVNTTVLVNGGIHSPFADNDITSTPVTLEDGRTVYVWKFPMPDECPNCLYVAFVPKGNSIECFYLEKSILVPWVTGTMQNGTHLSFTMVNKTPANAAAFVEVLREDELLD